jgi:hypothetical protein
VIVLQNAALGSHNIRDPITHVTRNEAISDMSTKGRQVMSMQDEDVIAEFEEVAAANSDGAEVAHEAEAEAEEEHGEEDAAESDEDEADEEDDEEDDEEEEEED